jgi:hypothetical protein
MTSILLDVWLLQFDKQMTAEKFKVALLLWITMPLILQTAALKNVSVYFPLPKTTSKTQRMHAGGN